MTLLMLMNLGFAWGPLSVATPKTAVVTTWNAETTTATTYNNE